MSTVDAAEIEHFSALAKEWWNPHGKFKPLHKFNPVRLGYIKDKVSTHFGRDPKAADSFKGLQVLDIGCGGGLVCEPLARLGAKVAGIDPSPVNIRVAGAHGEESGLSISYRAMTAEALQEEGARFDVVLALEVIEHVADVPLFLAACAGLVRPGGLLFTATINRTLKAWVLAIVGAEYILRWLPKGTHHYDKLVQPDEIESPLKAAGMRIEDLTGVSYNLLKDCWQLSRDRDVNYMMLACRPQE